MIPTNGSAPPKSLSIPSVEGLFGSPLLSPDSQLLVYFWQDPKNLGRRVKTNIVSVAGGDVLHSFEFPPGVGWIGWSPDGKAIDYAVTKNGVSDIWRQPLAGGAPKQLTHFSSGLIYCFAWSPDGKNLAVARGNQTADIVLLRARKPSR
jgi:Tol biopolymer transport system component